MPLSIGIEWNRARMGVYFYFIVLFSTTLFKMHEEGGGLFWGGGGGELIIEDKGSYKGCDGLTKRNLKN